MNTDEKFEDIRRQEEVLGKLKNCKASELASQLYPLVQTHFIFEDNYRELIQLPDEVIKPYLKQDYQSYEEFFLNILSN